MVALTEHCILGGFHKLWLPLLSIVLWGDCHLMALSYTNYTIRFLAIQLLLSSYRGHTDHPLSEYIDYLESVIATLQTEGQFIIAGDMFG